MDKARKAAPVILIDTREQRPLDFAKWPTRVVTLPTGDYSIEGLTHVIAFERKSLSDLFGTVGNGRERFEREIVRASRLYYFGIVIEATLEELLMGTPHSQMNPRSVIGSLHAWELRYPSIHVHFAGTRPLAAALVRKLLHKCAEYVEKGEIRFDNG